MISPDTKRILEALLDDVSKPRNAGVPGFGGRHESYADGWNEAKGGFAGVIQSLLDGDSTLMIFWDMKDKPNIT